MSEKERQDKLDALISLFTCPNCGEIKHRSSRWNGVDMCDSCKFDAWAGRAPKIGARNV